MSRRSNQATKLLRGGTPVDQITLAHDGRHRADHPGEWEIVEDALALFFSPEWRKASRKEYLAAGNELAGRLLTELRHGIATGKGDAFRVLADVVEMRGECYEPMRFWLLNFFALKTGTKFYSMPAPRKVPVRFSELRRAFDKGYPNGCDVDAAQLRRTVKELDIILTPDKPGPSKR